MKTSSRKKISPNKKFYAESNGAILRVVSRADETKNYSISLDQYELRKPEIFCWSRDSEAIGVFIARGIPVDAGGGYMSVKSNYWAGIWYPFQSELYTVHFADQSEVILDGYEIDSIKVLADERTVICSVKDREFKRVEMPKDPMLSNWEKEKSDLESVETEPPKTDKKEWTWNHTADGYEGVSLYSGEVLWFSHSHNPHAGGGACGQSFEDFLEKGPACPVPGEFYRELYNAVRLLASKKEK